MVQIQVWAVVSLFQMLMITAFSSEIIKMVFHQTDIHAIRLFSKPET